jgi:ribosome-binding factor A
MGTAAEQKRCMNALRHASGFIQSKLGDRMRTRFTPVIEFVLDEGVKRSIEMTRLINEALEEHAPKEGAEESPGAQDEAGSADGSADEDEPGGAPA